MKNQCLRPPSREAVFASSFEALESRQLFSAPYDFAAVGVRFDEGPRIFVTEGVLDANNDITGTTRFADADGVTSTDPIDWTSIVRGDEGAFTFGTRNGFTPYASQLGTQFIAEERWKLGSFVGRDANGEERDVAFITQLGDPGVFMNNFFVQFTRVTDGGELETFSLHARPSGHPDDNGYTFTYNLPTGAVNAEKTIVSRDGGRWEFDTGEVFFINNAEFLFIDMNASDGIVGYGMGSGVAFSYVDGNYRSTVLIDGPASAGFFGVDPSEVQDGPVAVNVVIRLQYWSGHIDAQDPAALPNTYAVYRQDEWDAGQRTPVREGVWIQRTDPLASQQDPVFVDMLDGDGGKLTLRRGNAAITFLSVESDSVVEQFQGTAALMPAREGVVQEFYAHVDPNGRPIAYLQFAQADDPENPEYFFIDLIDEAGGKPVVGSLVTWALDFRFVAGRSASGDVLLWKMSSDNSTWTFVNLTESIDGARPIDSDLFNTGNNNSNIPFSSEGYLGSSISQVLAGYDSDGNFIVYQSPARDYGTWEFVDVEVNGVGSAGFIPDFVGGLAGWASPWGAVHFTGIDANGDIWAIWRSEHMVTWNVDNLSDITGAPAMHPSRPAVVITAWNTFHIHATDAQGQLYVTWWAAELDSWESENLTAITDGPLLQLGSITSSYTPELRNINIVGLDDQGQAAIYWWHEGAGWNINSISQSVAPSEIPLHPWTMTWAIYDRQSFEPAAYSQSLLGTNADGDLVRLTWRSRSQDIWFYENLTEVSTVPFYFS